MFRVNLNDALSEGEQEVLRCVAQGLTDRCIGGALGISHYTVSFHLRNIRRKLNAASRTEAVTRARERGYAIG